MLMSMSIYFQVLKSVAFLYIRMPYRFSSYEYAYMFFIYGTHELYILG